MIYYGLIALSVILFGFNFALNDQYRKYKGSSLKISMQYSLIGVSAGFIALVLINGLKLEFTPFSFLIALLKALTGLGFTFCAFKALGIINLSVYSLFSMLGGMMLPFLQGIFFYNEGFTLAKGVCFALIFTALLLTVKPGESKRGIIYYVGIFVLNGMSGVLSKIFTEAPYQKTSDAGVTILQSLCSIALAALVLLFFKIKESKEKDLSIQTVGEGTERPPVLTKLLILTTIIACASGTLNTVANFILQYALNFVDASVQYPMITGGTMIVSTLICFFGENKPTKKEIASIVVSFFGILALVLIPI